MPRPTIEVKFKPADLPKRMARFPRKFNEVMRRTMEAALLTVDENVPSYPPPPAGSSYTRTHQLERSLTIGDSKNIHEIKRLGQGVYQGRFGTNLEYAQYPIGENQAWMHRGRWWTIKTVARRARGKVIRLFERANDSMARWLEGRGL